MGQGRQPRFMKGGNEEAGRDADRFRRVIMLDPLALRADAPALLEDGDEPGRRFEKRLFPVRAQNAERLQPFPAGAPVVEGLFLLLGGGANARLHVRVADRDEGPGLLVGA